MHAIVVRYRRVLVVGLHLVLIVLSNVLAFAIRFDGAMSTERLAAMVSALPILIVIRAAVFAWFRLYRGLWRYTDIWDLRDIALAVVMSSGLFYAALGGTVGIADYPPSLVLIDSLLLCVMMTGVRMTRRSVGSTPARKGATRVLVIGAGDVGELVVRDMKKRGDYEPLGFVDDDASKVGATIHGVRVLGTRKKLPDLVRAHSPDEVLIAITGGAASTVTHEIVRMLAPFTARICTLPSVSDLVSGGEGVSQHIRQVSFSDLLPRAAVGLDRAPLIRLIQHQRILVTGAGGSIGSELCHQIASHRPALLVLYERYENSLYEVQNELKDSQPSVEIKPCIGDVTDRGRLDEVLSQYQPTVIFHAAAHKHVPLMEANPCEAVKNNVRGTRLLAEAAERHEVERFILISSDKAVNPSSVMGVSKRVCELVVRARERLSATSFSIVRFGNVLGTNGSVLPRFADQIHDGGPVTVTHPEIKRYFMLISEAVELVLHAAAGGKPGHTYILEMGDQIRLLDLAKTLIRLGGYEASDIPIVFTGLRPGEKMYEELVGIAEFTEPSGIDKIMKVSGHESIDRSTLHEEIRTLERLADEGQAAAVVRQFKQIEPSFQQERRAPTTERAHLEPVAQVPPATAGAPGSRCPACQAYGLRRTRTQTPTGRFRRRFTDTRPYRCHECGWRGWIEPLEEPPVAGTPSDENGGVLDLGEANTLSDGAVSSRDVSTRARQA